MLQLWLENWQQFCSLHLETHSPVTIVTGPNASGKTSIRDALEFTLLGTGLLRGSATKRELARESILDGASATQCTLALEKRGVKIARLMDRKASQTVWVGEQQYKVERGDERIQQVLGLGPERIRAALEAEHVLAGDERARRTLLVAVSGAQVTRERLVEALGKTGLEEKDVSRLAKAALEEGFSDARKTAEAERAAQTRIVKQHGDERPRRIFHPTWAESEIDLGALTLETLAAREADLEARISEVDRSEGLDAGRLQQSLETAESEAAPILEEHGNATGEMGELGHAVEDLRSAAASLEAQQAEQAAAIEAAEAHHRECVEKRHQLAARSKLCLPEDFELIRACPAIPGGPKCPMTRAKLGSHSKALEKSAREASAALPGAEVAEVRAGKKLAELRDARDAVVTEIEQKQRLASYLEGLEERRRHAVEKLEAARSAMREAEFRATESKGDFYRNRLERCRATIRAKREYDSALARAETAEAKRSAAEAQRSKWDMAARLLSPDGLPSRLLAERVAPLNAFAQELDVAPVRVTSIGEFEAEICGAWRPYHRHSESWQLRLSIVASHVVARASGFPLLLVDRFDHLDPVGRRDVLGGLLRVASHYSAGVLVFATLGKAEPTPSGIDGVETIWLREGTCERIG